HDLAFTDRLHRDAGSAEFDLSQSPSDASVRLDMGPIGDLRGFATLLPAAQIVVCDADVDQDGWRFQRFQRPIERDKAATYGLRQGDFGEGQLSNQPSFR